MNVDFEQLPDSARIWVYQADRDLSTQEKAEAETILNKFTKEWTAHGLPLKTSFQIHYNRFVVLAADEGYNNVSGCSIDSAVHTIKEISAKIGMDFLNRNKVLFLINERIEEISLKELKEKYAEGTWNAMSITFNTLAVTKKELETWKVEEHKTWLKRYIETAAITSKA